MKGMHMYSCGRIRPKWKVFKGFNSKHKPLGGKGVKKEIEKLGMPFGRKT
jgi:hypothetical protein